MIDTVDELEAFLAPYAALEDAVNNASDRREASQRYAEAGQYILAHLKIPKFYTLRDLKPVHRVHAVEPFKYQVINEAGEVVFEAENVEEAYDFSARLGDTIFSGNYAHVDERWDEDRLSGSLSIPKRSKSGKITSYRLLISHTSTDSRILQYRSYLGFLQNALAYLKNPTDFMLAWNFLDHHPFAWYRWNKERPDDWATEGLISKMWLQPTYDKEGNILFMMEAGAAVEPERTSHYHDPRLDVYAPSFNDAIIEMAALVHKFFHLDGSERENVEYEKSELELTLEERMKEVEASMAEEAEDEEETDGN